MGDFVIAVPLKLDAVARVERSLARDLAHVLVHATEARGVVIVQHRTENLRIIPVFGKAAVDVSPRVGHLHVTVDDRPGTWAHTSGDPIIVVGLKPGLHKMLIELADPSHRILGSETVSVSVPEPKASSESHAH